MVFGTLILVAPLLAPIVGVYAANDWNTPCFKGECEYDLPGDQASGTLKISGPARAISDITPAAGWTILDCKPDVASQDIRIFCDPNGPAVAGCGNLYKHDAEDKIIRLPEHCGANPFARVQRAFVPKDQSIPPEIQKTLGNATVLVKALHIDVNWGHIFPLKHGIVHMALTGFNAPGAGREVSLPRRGRFDARSVEAHEELVSNAAILHARSDPASNTTYRINFGGKFNLYNESISCPPHLDAGVSVDLEAKMGAVITVGTVAKGTMVPPLLSEFSFLTNVDGSLEGDLNIGSYISGNIDSGEIPLYTLAIPGFSYPGIFEVGPSFKVLAKTKAKLDAHVDVKAGINYRLENAQFIFPPPWKKPDVPSFGIVDTPLKLSVSPSVKSNGHIEAHLIPKLSVGLTAFNSLVDAEVFLSLDANAALDLKLNGAGSYGTNNGTQSPSQHKRDEPAQPSWDGQVKFNAGLDINAGAKAEFFNLFNNGVKWPLYSKQYEVFNKSFGGSKPTRRSDGSYFASVLERDAEALATRADIACPAFDLPSPAMITDGIVKAFSMRTL